MFLFVHNVANDGGCEYLTFPLTIILAWLVCPFSLSSFDLWPWVWCIKTFRVCVLIMHYNLSPICLGSMAIFMLRDFYVSWRISRYAFDLVLCNIMRFLACCLCPQLGHSFTTYHFLKMLSPTILLSTPSFGTEIRGIDTARIVIFVGRLCFYTQFDALRRIR